MTCTSSEKTEERSVSLNEVGFNMPHEQMSVVTAQDNGLKTITPESDESSQTGSEETNKPTNATVSRDKRAINRPSEHLLREALQDQPVKKMRMSNFEHSLQIGSTQHSASKRTIERTRLSLDERIVKTLPRYWSPGTVQGNTGDTLLSEPTQSPKTGSSLQQFLTRTISLDPNVLQRPPSHITINYWRSQKKTFEQSALQMPIPKEREIAQNASETGEADESASVHKESGTSGPKDIAQFETCIECVKPVPVSSMKEIEVGDHIIFPGAVYDHHGIVVGKPEGGSIATIVEATNTISGVAVGIPFGRKAILASSDKAFDFSKQKIWVVYYRTRLYSKQEVAERAVKYVENEKQKYKYNLMANNCEHFATYCVTGEKFSIQVTKLRLTLRLFLSKGFLGISDENVRNKQEYENKIICGRCFEMNKSLLSVNAKPITKSSDVKEGDVIRYSYWNLWHDSVVLKVKDEHQKYVVCEIAHYAFCGLFSYRKIKSEPLKVSFDGKCKKLEYEPPNYDVYDSKTVVERAKCRLGEQEFVFFSNDSSHYARWCKLKLKKPVEEVHSEVTLGQ